MVYKLLNLNNLTIYYFLLQKIIKYVCHPHLQGTIILSVNDIFGIQKTEQQKLGDVDELKDGLDRN